MKKRKPGGRLFKKGQSGNPTGRKKGSHNKATAEMKGFMVAFVQRNESEAQALWDRVKKKDPYRALMLLKEFAEFVHPKVARTEVTGAGGDPLVFTLNLDTHERPDA
jgi:hypothetical protein